MKWLLCVAMVAAFPTSTYANWRKRHHLLPPEQAKEARRASSLCQYRKAEKAHYDAEVGGSFLQRKKQPKEEGPPGKEVPKALPYDGYFNFGCYMDESPKESRLDYKEEMERLFEEKEPVSAKVCFEFCRDRPEYKFFGLTLGRDCYCAKYTKRAPGGSDKCTRQCEGNPGQMCGGDFKASLYEMHRCSDQIEESEDTLQVVEEFQGYVEGLTTNASYLLTGMDMTADAIDVTEVRHEIFNNSRTLNRFIRDLKDLDKECEDKKKVVRELIPNTDPANVEDLRKLEESTKALQKQCGEAPGNPEDGTAFQSATHGLYKFLNGHDVQSALAAGGASLDGVMAEGKSGKPPSAMNRMTDAAIEELGCDDEPADGCDGFNLIYWPQGSTAEWFSDFYIPADNNPPMSAEEWKLQFMWMCKDLCDHFDGCVAGDVYGSIEDGASQYSANCALKKKVNRVLLARKGGEFGYGFDQGFIIEGYFQIVKDELPFIIKE